MTEINWLLRLLMLSFCVFIGYQVLGFEMLVVTSLALIFFKISEYEEERMKKE